MKKVIILLSMLMLLLVVSCSNETVSVEDNNKKTIVVTTFYQYDFVKNILGENINSYNLILLNESGTDLHSYSPTAKDIITINNSDLFIYNGGVSEFWVNDVIKSLENDNLKIVNVMDNVDTKAVEIIEGMEEDEHETDSEIEMDEHIWLSPKKAITIVDVLYNNIVEIDSENQTIYENNKTNYQNELKSLDEKFTSLSNTKKLDTIVVADRFPFLYLANDYDINYYAAFEGCSSESNASFETVTFLANKVDENNLNSIIITETSDGSIAKSVSNATKSKNQSILTLNAMQTVSMKNIEDGANYLKLMNDNLLALTDALN